MQVAGARFDATSGHRRVRANSAIRVVDTSADETLFVFDDGNRRVVKAVTWAPQNRDSRQGPARIAFA